MKTAASNELKSVYLIVLKTACIKWMKSVYLIALKTAYIKWIQKCLPDCTENSLHKMN